MSETDIGQRIAAPASNKSLRVSILRIWRNVLNKPDLTVDDDFFESGGDSLLATDVVLEIERLTGKALSTTALFEVSNVRELVERLAETAPIDSSPIIRLHTQGAQSPLLFFHGDYSNEGYYLKNFAAALGPELPVVGIAPHGMRNEPVPQTIVEMAVQRLPFILAECPTGPYRLGGHCMGGLVAFETARLLVEAGHEVEIVVLVDTPSMTVARSSQILLSNLIRILRIPGISSNRRDRLIKTTMLRLHDLPQYSMAAARAWSLSKWLSASVTAFRTALGFGKRDAAASARIESLDYLGRQRWKREWVNDRAYLVAAARHRPQPLDVPIVHFSSQLCGRIWRRISPDAEVVELRGGHYDWITIRAAELGLLLRARLQSVDPGAAKAEFENVLQHNLNDGPPKLDQSGSE